MNCMYLLSLGACHFLKFFSVHVQHWIIIAMSFVKRTYCLRSVVTSKYIHTENAYV